jgi:THO complex subunit 4
VRDARAAIAEFDGANANGQPIRLSLVPLTSGGARGAGGRPQPGQGRSLFERIDKGDRRREGETEEERGGRGGGRGRDGRGRRSDVTGPPPEHIDRYVPSGHGSDREGGAGGREPRRDGRGSRGGPGAGRGGRRPGQRRDARGGGDNKDKEGHAIVQGRPRKTAEELDQEMSDYWGGGAAPAGENGNGDAAAAAAASAAPEKQDRDGDVDMDA